MTEEQIKQLRAAEINGLMTQLRSGEISKKEYIKALNEKQIDYEKRIAELNEVKSPKVK